MTRRIALPRLALVLALVLAAPADAQPRRGGTLNFGIASGDVTVGVDPHVIQGERTGWVLSQVTEGLIGLDTAGNPVPLLALAWTVSDDGLAYRFALRPGVLFHNGRTMGADDVAYTIRRILDPRTGSRDRQQMAIVDAVDVADPQTVVLRLRQPFSPFIAFLSGMTGPILARESVRPDGSVVAPIGTGPFRFIDWQSNGPVELARFDRYWRPDLPHIDRLVFKPLPDEATRLTALRTGQVDIINAVPAQLVPGLLRNKQRGFELVVAPGSGWDMAIMNTRRPPFDDARVRQAVSYAIDRQELMLARTSGLGRVDTDTWPKGSFWHVGGEAPRRDLARARALLAAAGHPNGFRFSIAVRDVFLDDAQVLQQQLKDAGLIADIKVLDWSVLRPRLLAYDYDMAVSSAGSYTDPDGRYGRFYTEHGAANYFAGGWHDDEVDRLVQDGRRLIDPAQRRPIYRRISEIVQQQVPHAILYFSPFSMAWAPKVQEFRWGADGELAVVGGGLAEVWLKLP